MLERFKTLRISTCVKETAREFQKAKRMEAANELGYCECVTCLKVGHYKEMHAGHFVGSRRNAVLFAEDNVHVQCNHCNTYLSGNQEAYTRFMLKTYGQEKTDVLLALRNETKTFDREELVRMRMGYMDRVKRETKRIERGPLPF